jgi:hypothetical protein
MSALKSCGVIVGSLILGWFAINLVVGLFYLALLAVFGA